MRNISWLYWILLLMRGLSGADENTVNLTLLVGDSITLNTGLNEIPKQERMRWFFREKGKEDVRIAEISGEIIKDIILNEKFEGKLKMDKKNRSLTITNINNEHAGVYTLKNTKEDIIISFNVSIKDGVVTVMQGDSVTLHTAVTPKDAVKWKFGNQDLNGADLMWGNSHRNDQTGELQIINIRGYQEGNYTVEINSASAILHKTFNVKLNGVFSVDGVKPVSAKEGKPVELHTLITNIPEEDGIEWTFGPQNTFIIKIDREHKIISQNNDEEIFKNRLTLDKKSGDLKINSFTNETSGLYQIKILKSTHTIQKRFNVTVSVADAGVSPGAEAGIVVALLVFLWCLQL